MNEFDTMKKQKDAIVAAEVESIRVEERKSIARIMRLLEAWGQLNIKDFPLVTALVERLERGESVANK